MNDEDLLCATYENYGQGKPPVRRPRAATIEELQAQIDGFVRKHPIAEDKAMTARADAIILRRKMDKKTQ